MKGLIQERSHVFALSVTELFSTGVHSVAIYTRAPMINSIVIDFNNEHAFLTQDIVDRVP